IPDFHHLKRQIRYVHLNPCRSRLVRDPMEWEWSTHRDVLGAVGEAWVDLPQLHRIWGARDDEFRRIFHAYVSGDPSALVEGTPLPQKPAGSWATNLTQITDAVQRAARAPS